MGFLNKVAKKTGPGTKSGVLASYDSPKAPPRTINISADSWPSLIEKLTIATHRECQQQGSSLPYVVLREVVENLVHARFSEVVVSVLDGGSTVRISDQGPGIKDKTKAFLPGFTTATTEMRRFIRGVGSGLPVVKELVSFSGGTVLVEDNLSGGTVVTISVDRPAPVSSFPVLSKRQVSILSLITELGSAGPSVVCREIDLSLSTVHRELVCLEEMNLIESGGQGKRAPTLKGISALNKIVSGGDY